MGDVFSLAQGVWRVADRQAKRLKELEQEYGKLKRLVANLSLDNLALKDIVWGNDQITVQDSSAKDLRRWLADVGAKLCTSKPGFVWENGYCDSFNSKVRDEFSMVRSSTQ